MPLGIEVTYPIRVGVLETAQNMGGPSITLAVKEVVVSASAEDVFCDYGFTVDNVLRK